MGWWTLGPEEDESKKAAAAQEEAKKYLQQLNDAQGLVDLLSSELNKSQQQVAALIKHNTRLLDELKKVNSKEGVNVEDHRMLRQELYILKGCLFLGALWIWCGGRADVIGMLAFVWILADVAS